MDINAATANPASAQALGPQTSVAAQKNLPINPNQSETNRSAGQSLAGEIASNVTRGALASGEEAAKKAGKVALTTLLHTTIGPLTAMIHHSPAGPFILKPLSSWFARKIEDYSIKHNVNLPLSPQKLAETLLEGHYSELSDELVETLSGFVQKSLSPELRQAIHEGSLLKISKLTGLEMASGVKGLMGEIKKTEGNMFTKFFKFLGNKIPLINRLPKGFQPWAAGAFALTFGGMIVRGAIKLLKWVILGGGLIAGWNFIKNILMKSGGGGGMGGMLGALGGAGGAGHGAGGAGVGDLINMGSKLLGGLAKR